MRARLAAARARSSPSSCSRPSSARRCRRRRPPPAKLLVQRGRDQRVNEAVAHADPRHLGDQRRLVAGVEHVDELILLDAQHPREQFDVELAADHRGGLQHLLGRSPMPPPGLAIASRTLGGIPSVARSAKSPVAAAWPTPPVSLRLRTISPRKNGLPVCRLAERLHELHARCVEPLLCDVLRHRHASRRARSPAARSARSRAAVQLDQQLGEGGPARPRSSDTSPSPVPASAGLISRYLSISSVGRSAHCRSSSISASGRCSAAVRSSPANAETSDAGSPRAAARVSLPGQRRSRPARAPGARARGRSWARCSASSSGGRTGRSA